MSRVLVTGASGFLASHVMRQLLETGEYKVRGTVRSLANETKVIPLRRLCPENAQYELELVEADLINKASWQEYVSNYYIITALTFYVSGCFRFSCIQGSMQSNKITSVSGGVQL